MNAPTNSDDMIDVRDLIERFETLEPIAITVAGEDEDPLTAEEVAEYEAIGALLDDLKGYGGDHEWRGDWYPVTLVRDSYFKEYAQELADDTGAVNANASWPNNCIDWEQATRELRMDYTSAEFEGVTYWYR